MTITYEYEGALYVNLTNKCNCNCEFCLRHGKKEFTTPGTWTVVDGGVYISMKNADTKMRMEDFDAQPVDETDAQTVAAIAKMKSDGFLKKIEEQVSKPLFKSFSEEFGKKGESHLQFKNVKISGGVMTLTEAEVGDMTLKRVGD